MDVNSYPIENYEEAVRMVGGANAVKCLSEVDIDQIQQILDDSSDDEECFEANAAIPKPKKN